MADEAQTNNAVTPVIPDQDKKITIIGGKKFFPLSGAKHFYGSQKPMPVVAAKEPQVISTMHKSPLPLTQTNGRNIGTPIPAVNNANNNGPVIINNSITNTRPAPTTASKVLDVFEPEGTR